MLETTPQGTVPGKGEGKEENKGRHYPPWWWQEDEKEGGTAIEQATEKVCDFEAIMISPNLISTSHTGANNLNNYIYIKPTSEMTFTCDL